jgi:hypothetical protein
MTRTRTNHDPVAVAAEYPTARGDNPYLREGVERGYFSFEGDSACAWMTGRERRDQMVVEYSWAVPNDAALDAIAAHGPILEIGAGGGYWAHLLQERGVDVEATDPKLWHKTENALQNERRIWCGVHKLTATEAVEAFPDRTLFVCWPSLRERWSDDALDLYAGAVVLYVGEDEWGCTGSERFHDRLMARYQCEDEIQIPQWPGIHDSLTVWRRR